MHLNSLLFKIIHILKVVLFLLLFDGYGYIKAFKFQRISLDVGFYEILFKSTNFKHINGLVFKWDIILNK